MFLNIKPLEGFGWDCFSGLVASVATWWGCKYELIFADSWVFTPLVESYSLNQNYELLITNDRVDVNQITRYSNIRCDFQKNNRADEVIQIIVNELYENRPVMLEVDSYYIPWFTNGYKTSHIPEHYILIIGYKDLEFHCTDVAFMEYDNIIPRDEIISGYLGSYLTFSKLEQQIHRLEKNDCLKLVRNTVEKMLGNVDNINRFQSMRLFATQFMDLYKLSFAEQHVPYWNKKVYMNVKFMLNGRIQFSYFLKYIGAQYNDPQFLKLYENLLAIIKEWRLILILFGKSYYRNFDIKIIAKIPDKIHELSKKEEKLALAIIKAITPK